MTARHKLLLLLLLGGLVGSVLISISLIWLTRHTVREDLAARARAESALLAEWVRTQEQDPQDLARRSGERLGLRVTLISADGTVLGDSERKRDSIPAMDNHLDRPEIQAALHQGSGASLRRSDTTSVEYLYSAHRIEGPGRVKFARLAVPMSMVRQQLLGVLGPIVAVVLGATLLLGLGVYGLMRGLSKPVEQVSLIAERTAAGELDLEVPELGHEEVYRLAVAFNRMKRALVEKIGEVQAERALVASVVAGMREGLLLVDPDRRVGLANEAARSILGLRFDPAGYLLGEVVRYPGVVEAVERVLKQGMSPEQATIHRPESGQSFEVRISPLGREAGPPAGVLVLFLDISRLEALERVRREFVANVSHELRTPLTSIKAFVETLIEDGLRDRDNSLKFLGIAQKHADRMGALIDDLTDLSLIETGAIHLDFREVDVRQVARDVREQLQRRAAEHEVKITVDAPSPFPMRADRRRLEQMLLNLVDNGIKFNRPGGEVRVIGRAPSGMVQIVVEDTGTGIPTDSLEKIFHRFYRVDPDRSREAGGTGLGLAIVKHLVRLHGGTVRVESELGGGTRFILEFPRGEPVAA